MTRHVSRAVVFSFALAAPLAAPPVGASPVSAWPPWLSIEAPVNPFDPATRGATLLVHTFTRDGIASLADLSGSAEGVVGDSRRSVELRFDVTSVPGVYALRRQWPTQGVWLLRITLEGHTTALAVLDPAGAVAGVRVPTQAQAGGVQVPRSVAMREIDSTLAAISRR